MQKQEPGFFTKKQQAVLLTGGLSGFVLGPFAGECIREHFYTNKSTAQDTRPPSGCAITYADALTGAFLTTSLAILCAYGPKKVWNAFKSMSDEQPEELNQNAHVTFDI